MTEGGHESFTHGATQRQTALLRAADRPDFCCGVAFWLARSTGPGRRPVGSSPGGSAPTTSAG